MLQVEHPGRGMGGQSRVTLDDVVQRHLAVHIKHAPGFVDFPICHRAAFSALPRQVHRKPGLAQSPRPVDESQVPLLEPVANNGLAWWHVKIRQALSGASCGVEVSEDFRGAVEGGGRGGLLRLRGRLRRGGLPCLGFWPVTGSGKWCVHVLMAAGLK